MSALEDLALLTAHNYVVILLICLRKDKRHRFTAENNFRTVKHSFDFSLVVSKATS